MSWIKDVKNEILALDVSDKSLKKFGLTIGAIFLLLGILFLYKDWNFYTTIVFIMLGGNLIVNGLISPQKLKNFYKVWMGFAFALGWVVSRLILIILFYLVLLPIGLLAKIFGKEFLDLKFKDGKPSYWIPKEKRKIDYEKLY